MASLHIAGHSGRQTSEYISKGQVWPHIPSSQSTDNDITMSCQRRSEDTRTPWFVLGVGEWTRAGALEQ